MVHPVYWQAQMVFVWWKFWRCFLKSLLRLNPTTIPSIKHIVHSIDLRGAEFVPMEVIEVFGWDIGDSCLGSRSACGVADDAGQGGSDIPGTSAWMYPGGTSGDSDQFAWVF